MAKQLGYADALKTLGAQDRPLLDFAENLVEGSLGLLGVTGLLGTRKLLVRHGRKALEGFGEKLRGTDRLSRTAKIEAAHKVLLVVSFFEPLDTVLAKAGVPLRAADLELTAEEQRVLVERGLRADEVYAPAEDFLWDHDTLWARAETVLGRNTEALIELIRGLSATERAGVDTGHGSRLATAVRQRLPRMAQSAYRDHYLRLCAEAPEFGMWAQLREHERTRHRVSDAFAGLHRELSRISSGRPVGDLRSRLSRKYRALLGKHVLPMDDVLPEDLPAGMVIPSLSDCYVPPSARVARVKQGDTPSAKEWWEARKLLPDLQHFLAARLTHPDMTRYPTVLLGEPGAGKSKLTEVLAAQLPAEDFLTVRVELRSVSADAALHTQIEEGLEQSLREQVRWTDLLAEAHGALPVIILDGFDELLQAAGVERHNYLEEIRDLQTHQKDMGQPVAVIVTSRTLSASRARFPEHSTVIRLEPFSEEQIQRVLKAWNQANRERFRSPGLQPLGADRLLAYPELSRQPLLLLMLLVYDAQDNDLQQAPDRLSLGQLYERLLTTFVRRQVRKHRKALSEADLRREVKGELRRLEAAALAMFTRQRQSVGSRELSKDLKALKLDSSQQRSETGANLPIQAADLLLGRFFFVHMAQAKISGPDQEPLSAYEFLHATFGEYLVARMVAGALRSLVEQRIRQAEDPWAEPASDGTLYAVSSFASYASRERTVDFLKELICGDVGGDEERREHYSEQLIELFQQAPYPSADHLHSAYQPRTLPLTSRQAHYTANLLILLLLARVEPVDLAELFTDSGSEPSALYQWRAAASLWRTLPSADWFRVLDALRVRHLAVGRSVLQLEDRSPVNVGEGMGFAASSGAAQIPNASVLDPYQIEVPYRTGTAQLLRSIALRVNGSAASLMVGLVPYLQAVNPDLGSWQWGPRIGEGSWSPVHELLLLRLNPVHGETERRLDAYHRLLLPSADLFRSEIPVLRQAAEDFASTLGGTEYLSRLRHLVTKRLAGIGPDGTAHVPITQVEQVLSLLEPHLGSRVAANVLGQLRQPPDETREPSRSAPSHEPPKAFPEPETEHSVVDIQYYLDDDL